MLTERRQEIILNMLSENGSVTVTELKAVLGASESTIRRDITQLDAEGKLERVFGGALSKEKHITGHEYSVTQKQDLYKAEKEIIGRFAATFLEEDDFVYLDAGTTTAYMIDHIPNRRVSFMTNGIEHARRIAERGNRVILVGGELKASTEALIGGEALTMLDKYHFTKGFFGVNGVSKEIGFTTPDANEAIMKKTALSHCKEKFILCDHSKFGEITPVTFAAFTDAIILTDEVKKEYKDCKNVREGKSE